VNERKAVSRRAAFGASAALLLGSAPACAAREPGVHTLVAYFTRSGHTRVIAAQLHRELKADLFEIAPAEPYPEDYEAQVRQATRERDAGYRPKLKAALPAIGAYELVLLCFPIWGETAPPTVRSFLATHDLAGKTLRPIITHGGYGVGSAPAALKAHAPKARILAPFVMEADQERRTMTTVRGWMADMQRG
jgi:flavodoxin